VKAPIRMSGIDTNVEPTLEYEGELFEIISVNINIIILTFLLSGKKDKK
jgi:hypothetical protein